MDTTNATAPPINIGNPPPKKFTPFTTKATPIQTAAIPSAPRKAIMVSLKFDDFECDFSSDVFPMITSYRPMFRFRANAISTPKHANSNNILTYITNEK